MVDAEKVAAAHKFFASDCFNKCWDLIDLKERTELQTEEMIRLSEVSFFHWNQVHDKTDQNLSVGLWQLARVYALAGRSEQALRYGERCVAISEKAELPPFYVAYGYEGVARAQKVAGQPFAEALKKAKELTEKVTDEGSAKMLKADLATIEGS